MTMASIPGAQLPDTVPSDALLYAAKMSIAISVNQRPLQGGSGWAGAISTRRAAAAATGKAEALLGQESAVIRCTEAAAHTSAAGSTLVEAANRKWGGHRE